MVEFQAVEKTRHQSDSVIDLNEEMSEEGLSKECIG